MTPDELIERRKKMLMTQAQLAELLGMSLRGYQKLESGESPIKLVYGLAMDRAALMLAVARGEVDVAPPSVRHDALELVHLITGRGHGMTK